MPKIITKTGTPRSSDAATYVVGVTRPTASYLYLADGTKVQAIGETGQGYEYVGSLRLSVNGSGVDIESIPFAGGRIVKTTNGYEPQYYITDHLGSTRTVVKPNATVVAEFDYMPYGTQHSVAGAPITEADYKYTGKEQQTAFGLDNLYDSQARFQYVKDGMFLSHDDLAGKFPWLSPYNYCAGNPINIIDPYGLNNYLLNSDGTISLDGEYNEDDEYDFLYVAGNRKKSIRVKGSQFLYDLSQQRTDYDGHVAITSNKNQAFKVFKFVADNSNVEWSLNGFRTDDGNKYVLSTINDRHELNAYYGKFEITDQIFDMHTHPGAEWEGASGYNIDGFTDGDKNWITKNYWAHVNAGMTSVYLWYNNGKRNTKFTTHYIYHPAGKKLYHYTPWNNNIFIRNISSSLDLYRNLGL